MTDVESPGSAESSAPSARERLLAALPLLRARVAFLARRYHLDRDWQEEIESRARLRLLEDDGRLLQQWREEASLGTYLGVVVQRIFHDCCNERWGKWRTSAAARRLGPLAVELEQLLYREGLSFEEARQVLAPREGFDAEQLQALLAELPARPGWPRPEPLAVDEVAEPAAIFDPEQAALRCADELVAGRVIADGLRKLPPRDRLLLALHFGQGLTVAQVARALRAPQKRLYRRLATILRGLRKALEGAGLGSGDLERLLQHRPNLDFDLEPERENSPSWPSRQGDGEPHARS